MTAKAAATSDIDRVSRRDLVWKTLRASRAPRAIVDLAEQLDIHPNTVRFHLASLVKAGRVEQVVGPSAGVGRPPVKYSATVAMNPDGPTNYRFLATVLTRQITENSDDPSGEARNAGRGWSESLVGVNPSAGAGSRAARMSRGDAVKRVASTLADLGFNPDPVSARSSEIRLRHCPFLDLVPGNAEVVCSLHLGLMQGAFNALDSPVNVERLDAFVQPDLCVARLAPVPT